MRKSKGLQYVGNSLSVELTKASPVRVVQPVNREPEPAELCTIATAVLRRNKALYADIQGDSDKRTAYALWSASQERTLSNTEAKLALAIIAKLKGEK